MDRRVTLAVAVFLAVSLVSVSGAAAAQDTETIQVGGEKTVTASVSNPLDVPDILRVTFDGEAVNTGLVGLDLPSNQDGVECSPAENTCRVILGPDEERDLPFTLTGKTAGRSTFMVTVSSATTGKRAEATMTVAVRGKQGGGFMTFLRRALGLS